MVREFVGYVVFDDYFDSYICLDSEGGWWYAESSKKAHVFKIYDQAKAVADRVTDCSVLRRYRKTKGWVVRKKAVKVFSTPEEALRFADETFGKGTCFVERER